MISPDEIRSYALKWWKSLLRSEIAGEQFFPKTIDRIGKVKSEHITQRFELLQHEIELLFQHSKNQTGGGYLVKTAGRNFRRTGSHELPEVIVLETLDDYLVVTRKKKEWNTFFSNYKIIVASIPSLKSWAFDHCLWLTQPGIIWKDVIKVCHYFIHTPKPDLYLRQLPIEIHTKFIEENEALIQSLLDFLIPEHVRSPSEKRFVARFFLKYDEPLIRVRFLDGNQQLIYKFLDLSVPLSDFEKFEVSGENVLIAENKMNFLTLPPIPSTIAIWSGGGFNIGHLKNTTWLLDKNIFYWGDIDEHGFQILHQLRSHFGNVKSILMDRTTFDLFNHCAVEGARNKSAQLDQLTSEETALFQFLKLSSKNRLEQEKIPQAYVDAYLKNAVVDCL